MLCSSRRTVAKMTFALFPLQQIQFYSVFYFKTNVNCAVLQLLSENNST